MILLATRLLTETSFWARVVVWDDDAVLAARTYVEAVAERLGRINVVVNSGACMAPDVACAIVDAAERASTDIIVMSTHGLSGPARALLGSADAVVRTSHCLVLLVKPADGHVARAVSPAAQSSAIQADELRRRDAE